MQIFVLRLASCYGGRMSKLLVIVGPTASGKSALGLKLAQRYNGEIINADSRAVYRYMSIGTAKPTHEEMLLIPHHLVDIKNPDEPYSAAQFKQDALAAIEKITAAGKMPIMVGGTGLYVDSLLFDYQFPKHQASGVRKQLEGLSLEQLVTKLMEVDPDVASTIDLKNPRRVQRAIETAGSPRGKSDVMRSDTLVLGLALNKEVIQKRIYDRIEKMLSRGLIDEVKRVGETYGWDTEAMTGPAYRAFKDVVLGDKLIAQGVEDFAKADLQLAKRQMTWFKRNQQIVWLDAEDPHKLEQKAGQMVGSFVQS